MTSAPASPAAVRLKPRTARTPALAALAFLVALTAAAGIDHHDPVPQADLVMPAAGTAIIDPVFGTQITRISNARASGREGIIPEYSRRQAWNADESLLLLRSGDGAALLFDGTTYQFRRQLDGVEGEDVFWHPTDPATILYNPQNALYAYDVTSGEHHLLQRFADYTYASTRGEGNLSADGRYYAFVGWMYEQSSGDVTFKDLVVYDLVEGRVLAKQPLPAHPDDFDWVSMSPGGGYVVVDYADERMGRFHGVEVYDRDFKLIWQKGLGAGHSDLGIDAHGDDVLVIGIYDGDTNSIAIKSYRLADGQETVLLDRLSWMFDLHVSCRNEDRRGWCVISTYDSSARLTDTPASWLPFEDELFFLNLDGSRSVERLAHHRSRRFTPATPEGDRSNYFAEPHATVSRRGDRVLFGSNWRQDVADPTGVDAYVVAMRPGVSRRYLP